MVPRWDDADPSSWMPSSTNHTVKLQLGSFFQVTDELFVAVYATEFLLKVIKVSSLPLVNALFMALYRTVKSGVDVSLIGAQCFWDLHGSHPVHCGGLDRAVFTLFTLFSMVTVHGWTDHQEALDPRVVGHTRFFTTSFIILSNFILKHAVGKRNREEVRERQELPAGDPSLFPQLVPGFKHSLCPDDIMVTGEPCTSLTAADVHLISLEDQDHRTRKLRRLCGDIAAKCLCDRCSLV
ncbi:unnamed protein product [Arctogadus glacialis]